MCALFDHVDNSWIVIIVPLATNYKENQCALQS